LKQESPGLNLGSASNGDPSTPPDASEEIAELIATLLATERRLEELAPGAPVIEADLEGRSSLARRAQDRVREIKAAQHTSLALALQRQQMDLRVLFDLMPALIWFKDTENGILRVNQRVAELTGRPVEEIEGRPSRDIYPEDAERFYADDLEVIKSGVPKLGIVEKITDLEGKTRWVATDKVPTLDSSGRVTGIVVMARDITTSRLAEARLLLQSAALNAAADAILIIDREFRIVWANPSFTELTGYTEEEAVGKDPRVLLASGLQDPEFYREVSATILRGESWRGEMTNRRKDGRMYLEELLITPVKDDKGVVEHFVSIKRDLTAHREMEGQLRHAQKMEAVGQLAAGVAHEFNNLLQALTLMSAKIRFRAASKELADFGADMEGLIMRGAGLTQQLLLFSRNQAIERVELNLCAQIEEARALLQHIMPETLRIVVDVPDEPLQIAGDAGQIQQILLNLAINARDAMNAGGTLTLRAGRDGEHVFLEVQDTGIGMDEETQSHLFEPFYTTKDRTIGTGLGLAVTHGIVEQHGGRIEVESHEGLGSRFRIRFPVSNVGERGQPEAVAEITLHAGGGRVLLVEDEPSVREGIETLLDLIGYQVVAAGSAEEALALSLTFTPDLLLSDVTLPGKTGPALAEELRKRWPALKVVLMSGYVEETMQESARRNRWRFLQKPFELADLTRELAGAMNEVVSSVALDH
jgi:two-component system cell cycle sensor histidine kinase/response regulator CckA